MNKQDITDDEKAKRKKWMHMAHYKVQVWLCQQPQFFSNWAYPSCEQCGNANADAHHDSYLEEDWLKIRWLCRSCHKTWHGKNEVIFPNHIT